MFTTTLRPVIRPCFFLCFLALSLHLRLAKSFLKPFKAPCIGTPGKLETWTAFVTMKLHQISVVASPEKSENVTIPALFGATVHGLRKTMARISHHYRNDIAFRIFQKVFCPHKNAVELLQKFLTWLTFLQCQWDSFLLRLFEIQKNTV